MNTPHAAPVRYAGFWIRFVAALIDTVLVTIIIAPVLYWLYGKQYFVDAFAPIKELIDLYAGRDVSLDVLLGAQAPTGWADDLLTYVFPAIAIVLFWISRQATPGKLLLSLKIVDAKTLGPLRVGQTILRYLGYYVSIFGLLIGFLWAAFDVRKQAWHDKIAGTLVIYAS